MTTIWNKDRKSVYGTVLKCLHQHWKAGFFPPTSIKTLQWLAEVAFQSHKDIEWKHNQRNSERRQCGISEALQVREHPPSSVHVCAPSLWIGINISRQITSSTSRKKKQRTLALSHWNFNNRREKHEKSSHFLPTSRKLSSRQKDSGMTQHKCVNPTFEVHKCDTFYLKKNWTAII